MGIGIVAVGSNLPDIVVDNAELSKSLDTSDEWIASRTGIRSRRIAPQGVFSSDLGIAAVRDLQERYPDALSGIDLIICCTGTPDAHFPSTGAIIGHGVGLSRVPAFDLSAACSGFVHGLNVVRALISSGQHKKVLLIGTETLSRIVDWQDRNTAILFGDGAGAVVLEEVPSPYGIVASFMGGDGSGGPLLYAMDIADRLSGVGACSPKLTQNGREVFKFAVRTVPEAILETLDRAGLTPDRLDLLIPHQANIRIIESAMDRLGLPLERAVINIDRCGNTSSASIPIALSEAVAQGRLHKGNHVAMIGFGGGLSWSTALFKWYER
ncbi:MAG: beta-ketoacyl-ACP synthase III [Deinococcaceae bacterium]